MGSNQAGTGRLATNTLKRWLVRPYVFWELPGWRYVYNTLVGDFRSDSSWRDEPLWEIRGKPHGYEMELYLGQWSERATNSLGRFYDLGTQLFLKQVLRPGDRMVDGGANVGMISLVCARLVGAQGVVDALEPNPRCIARIESFIEHNKITSALIHRMGLGASEEKLILSAPLYKSGEGTVATISDGEFGSKENVETSNGGNQCGRYSALRRFEASRCHQDRRRGFEYQVLRGLNETLREHRPFVLTEMDEALLKRAGS